MPANSKEPESAPFWFQSLKSPAWRLYALGCSYRLTFGQSKWIIRALAATACGIIKATRFQAPVAQLDRVSGYEPEGRRFESFRARHIAPRATTQWLFVFPGSEFLIRTGRGLTNSPGVNLIARSATPK